MSFIRKFSQEAIEALKREELFTEHLRHDIVVGKPRGNQKTHSFVFPAVRNERIDFYWGGGKLFSYGQSSGFTTHHKFASVLLGNTEDDYISQASLQNGNMRLIKNFCEGYDRIKENCEQYSGLEALGVSSLYERFSCARKEASSSVVILDIEAHFEEDENTEESQIDIVALDIKSGMIRFIEAKDYSNHESLRSKSENFAVVDQMKKYAKQIKKNEKEILAAYQNHVKVINAVFATTIPEPTHVDNEPILLIFGFDNEQKSYLQEKIEHPLKKDNSLRIYSIGEIKDANLSVVFRGGRANW
jgi:hypothetical protein